MNPANLDIAIAAEEQRLREEMEAAFDVARRRPTAKNRSAYERARSVFEEFQRDREAKSSTDPVLDGLPEVLSYLQGEEWKISQSTLYEHRDQGKLSARTDGTFLTSEVDRYALNHLRKLDGRRGAEAGGTLQQQKLIAEIRQKEHDADLRELKLRERMGELITKSHAEAVLASRHQELMDYLQAFFRSAAGRMIKIVGGDIQKSADLIAFNRKAMKKAMDNFSRPMPGIDDEEEG